jgi:hypothetical protein
LVFGSSTGTPPGMQLLGAARFRSTAAEWSNANIKSFMQTMGFTVPWT